MTDLEWFNAPWRTPQQTRDLLIELSNNLNLERIQELRALCLTETNKRKNNSLFVECPMCKNYHSQLENIDNLCEKHEAETAPMRYDKAKGTTK